jgi:hypothetical protein
MDDKRVRFSLQIFREDGAELLNWAANLPKNRMRRRSAIINLLKAGLSANGAPQALSAHAETPRSAVPVESRPAVARHAPALEAEAAEAGFEQQFDASDLEHIFRPNGA